MDMQFHWLRDREGQGQFKIYWQPGGTNLADYFTKHHLPVHHVNVRAEFLTRVKDLSEARRTKNEGQTKIPSNKIAMLQGCVRQTSLWELAQQISAKEKISNSPRGRFLKQQLNHVEGFQGNN